MENKEPRPHVPGWRAALLVAALAAGVILGVGGHRLGEAAAGERLRARLALTQTLGYRSLAVSSECTLTRTLMEGLAGCLGDVAGGYCTYRSCDIVARPVSETDYGARLSIVKASE